MPAALYDDEKAVPLGGGGAFLGDSQKGAMYKEETAHEAAGEGHYATDQCVAFYDMIIVKLY